MRTLNVKKVTKNRLEIKWKLKLPIFWSNILYIRCNNKGDVNWDKAEVYHPQQLVKRENYLIHK